MKLASNHILSGSNETEVCSLLMDLVCSWTNSYSTNVLLYLTQCGQICIFFCVFAYLKKCGNYLKVGLHKRSALI